MARLRMETDLKALALNRYDLLMSKRNEIEEEMKGLQVYLKALGENGTPKRVRRKKATPAPEVPSKAIPQQKSKAQAKETRTSKSKKKVSATESILSVIGKSEKGISIDGIMKQTGLGRLTVNGVLARMKKEGKVRAASRGVYVKQSSVGQSGAQGQKEKAESASKPTAVSKKASKAKAPVKRPSRAKKVSADNHRTIV